MTTSFSEFPSSLFVEDEPLSCFSSLLLWDVMTSGCCAACGGSCLFTLTADDGVVAVVVVVAAGDSSLAVGSSSFNLIISFM